MTPKKTFQGTLIKLRLVSSTFPACPRKLHEHISNLTWGETSDCSLYDSDFSVFTGLDPIVHCQIFAGTACVAFKRMKTEIDVDIKRDGCP